MSVTQRIALDILRVLPRRRLSHFNGMAARLPVPRPLRSPLYRAFARATGMDLREAELAPARYGSFNALFTRGLRHDARPLHPAHQGLSSPCDGILTTFGAISHDTLLQAKGMSYSLADLLGSSKEAAAFEGGGYATIYLTPRHYHRVHCPAPAAVVKARLIPGTLYPVYPEAARRVPGLFTRNERVAIHLESDLGLLCVVMVGASNVGSITCAFDPRLRSNTLFGGLRRRVSAYTPPVNLQAGDELATFNLGSTVVLLWQKPGGMLFAEGGAEVRLGQPLVTMPGCAKG